jgi:hypothetical protein
MRNLTSIAVSLLLVGAGVALDACKSNEAPPPLPAPKPVPSPVVANIVPEEEEEEAPAASASVAPEVKGGMGGSGGGLTPCCKALRQNAASAPPELKGHMLNAATLCDAANKQGLGKAAGFLSMLGGQVPAACK